MIRKRSIWIAPYLDEGEDEYGNAVSIYGVPFYLESSLNSLSGTTDIAVYGDRIHNMSKTLVNYEFINKIHEKDKVYLYGATPNGEAANGDNANYKVVAVMPQNIKIQVYFERLPDAKL